MKSWKDVERLAKAKDKLAKEMEELAMALVEKQKELLKLNIEQYTSAPEVDTLIDSSPNSTTKINNDFRFHLMKLGCPWEKRFDVSSLPAFTESIRLGNKWVLKFRPKNQESEGVKHV